MRLRYLLHTGAACLLFVGSALAQDVNRQDLAKFDRFLDSHPAIEKDLTKNPSLLKDQAYLSAHPELKTFLNANPNIRDMHENPRALMNRERAFDRTGKDITRPEVKNFDDFLDKHPAMEKELQQHPAFVNDPAYLAKHPELKQFLDSHPAIRNDLRENPKAFMKAEKKFDKVERKDDKRVEKRENRVEDRREARQEDRRQDRREVRRDVRVTPRPGGKH